LVEELLNRNHEVKAVVRSPERLPESIINNENLTAITAAILDLTDDEMKTHLADCDAVASCLGHNLTFKGIYGKPRRLVADSVRRLCQAVKANNPDRSIKFVLMNTVGNRNKDLNEPIPTGQKILVGLLRVLLPPQADNEDAAEYLRAEIGQNDSQIEWAAVRPSGLIDSEMPSEIEVYPSPTRSILNDGEISRINVGHFMANLITDNNLWDKWKGQMPVVYNKGTAFK
jgi:nucleoside-diphosphate-sugar epimerase